MTVTPEPQDPTPGTPGDGTTAGAHTARVTQINEHVGQLVDQLVEDERAMRALAARRATHIDQIRRLTLERCQLTISGARSDNWDISNTAVRETAAEISHALLLSSHAARSLITEAETLIYDLPATHTALAAGQISYSHAATIAHESWTLPDEILPTFERAAIPEAESKILPRFRDRVRTIRERLHPVPLEVRHHRALKDRTVWVDTSPDGMATLTYIDTAEKVIPIYHRIDQTARALRGPTEERTLTQLRADTLGDLGLHGTPSPDYDKGVVPTVLIAVPALTAMGEGMQPGMMDGYGPIDADTARRLAAKAPSFFRILTHPETGAILSLGRTTYTPPADMRRFLQLRDGTCRAFGCATRAERCDIDHTLDWQHGGQTDQKNLAFLCRSHHQFKGNTAWTLTQIGDGRLEWTSPSGKSYITEPNSFIGPMPFMMPTTPAPTNADTAHTPAADPSGQTDPFGPAAADPPVLIDPSDLVDHHNQPDDYDPPDNYEPSSDLVPPDRYDPPELFEPLEPLDPLDPLDPPDPDGEPAD